MPCSERGRGTGNQSTNNNNGIKRNTSYTGADVARVEDATVALAVFGTGMELTAAGDGGLLTTFVGSFAAASAANIRHAIEESERDVTIRFCIMSRNGGAAVDGDAAVGNRVRQPDVPIGLALKCPDLVIPPYGRWGRLVIGPHVVLLHSDSCLGFAVSRTEPDESSGVSRSDREFSALPGR